MVWKYGEEEDNTKHDKRRLMMIVVNSSIIWNMDQEVTYLRTVDSVFLSSRVMVSPLDT